MDEEQLIALYQDFINEAAAHCLMNTHNIPHDPLPADVPQENPLPLVVQNAITLQAESLEQKYTDTGELGELSELQIYLDLGLNGNAVAVLSAMSDDFIRACSDQKLYQMLISALKTNQSDLIADLHAKFVLVEVNIMALLEQNNYHAVHVALCYGDIEMINWLEEDVIEREGLSIAEVLANDDDLLKEVITEQPLNVVQWVWARYGDNDKKHELLCSGVSEYEFIATCGHHAMRDVMNFLLLEASRLQINIHDIFSAADYALLESLCANSDFENITSIKQFLASHGISEAQVRIALQGPAGLDVLWASFNAEGIDMVRSVWDALIDIGVSITDILENNHAGFYRFAHRLKDDDFLDWVRGLYRTHMDDAAVVALLRARIEPPNSDESVHQLVEDFLGEPCEDYSVSMGFGGPSTMFQRYPAEILQGQDSEDACVQQPGSNGKRRRMNPNNPHL